MNPRIRNLTGQTYGRLTVLQYAGPDKHGNATWLCRCVCNNTTTVVSRELTSGGTQSCGCLKKDVTIDRNTTHGLSHHPIYKNWAGMLQRCYNPKDPAYYNYGGREQNPIQVCEEWRHQPESFINWSMDNGYQPGLTIERQNNDGNYEPNNCIWATRTVQNRNTRRTTLTMEAARAIRSDTRLHREIADDYGIDASHVSDIKSHKVWKEN